MEKNMTSVSVYNEQDISDIARIKNIPVLVDGEHYTVERLADISYDISQAQIYHVNKLPTVEFGIMPKDNVSDMEMQGKVTQLMDNLQAPKSVTVKWAGMADDMDESLQNFVHVNSVYYIAIHANGVAAGKLLASVSVAHHIADGYDWGTGACFPERIVHEYAFADCRYHFVGAGGER